MKFLNLYIDLILQLTQILLFFETQSHYFAFGVYNIFLSEYIKKVILLSKDIPTLFHFLQKISSVLPVPQNITNSASSHSETFVRQM